MAKSLNKVMIIGHLGADPETRYMPSGGSVTNIRVATTDVWKDRQSGEKQERTEWHRIVFFNRLAEVAAQYLRKGSLVYVEGSLKTEKWQDQSGNERFTTKITASEMHMLDSKGGSAPVMDASESGESAPRASAPAKAAAPAMATAEEAFDDDIPF